MKVLYFFILGIIILVGAILLNTLASFLGLLSWFEFLKNPQKVTLVNYLWLLVIYPMCLGFIAYFSIKMLHLNL